jgi:REP element-mobilizing transposase RayT
MQDNLPNRKALRLKSFDYNTNAAYFVTICVKDRKPLLSKINVGDGAHDVPKILLTEAGKIVEKNLLSSEKIKGVKIDSYVIMPDHIHAIIVVDSGVLNGTSKAPSPTNQALPHIVSTFKRFCNKQLDGNIFQRGYLEHVIRDEEDYLTRVNYMYENPIRKHYKGEY